MRLKRKIIFSLLGFIVLFMGLIVVLSNTRNNHKGVQVVRIGILRVPNDMAVARETGELESKLKRQGLKVEFISFDSGVDANKALLSNDIQMATMGHTNAVVAMSAGIPANLVWVNDIIGSNEKLVMRHSVKFNTWSDLKGKKIATPFASTSHYSLMRLLKRHALTNKVELLDMQTSEIVAAWKQKNIDGAYTWEPSLSNLNQSKTIIDSKRLADENILTANVTLATTKFQKDNPAALRRILKVLATEHCLYTTNPGKVYKLAGRQMEIDTNDVKKQIGTSEWLTGNRQIVFMNHKFKDQFFQSAKFMWSQQTLSNAPTERQCCDFIETKFIK